MNVNGNNNYTDNEHHINNDVCKEELNEVNNVGNDDNVDNVGKDDDNHIRFRNDNSHLPSNWDFGERGGGTRVWRGAARG